VCPELLVALQPDSHAGWQVLRDESELLLVQQPGLQVSLPVAALPEQEQPLAL
jgi:hypothetical protein